MKEIIVLKGGPLQAAVPEILRPARAADCQNAVGFSASGYALEQAQLEH
ncbi:MAG: hypothetical protein ABSG46_03465 [Candidatus Binataceae bacterium]|jgi:hypothetical protein